MQSPSRPSTARLVVAALLLTVAGTAAADTIDLPTPAGLSPGDKFRFMFVTSSGTTATSGDITEYNTFVQNGAAGATYGGSTVTWKAIGSTTTVAARDNVGGFGTFVPVYLPSGIRVANDLTTNNAGLWGISPGNSLLAAPDEFIDGTEAPSDYIVWTGSKSWGLAHPYNPLGDLGVAVGFANFTNFIWIDTGAGSSDSSFAFYGVSEELTAVPEIDPSGLGSVTALVTAALGLVERRRMRRG
jgi:hypothetical protein